MSRLGIFIDCHQLRLEKNSFHAQPSKVSRTAVFPQRAVYKAFGNFVLYPEVKYDALKFQIHIFFVNSLNPEQLNPLWKSAYKLISSYEYTQCIRCQNAQSRSKIMFLLTPCKRDAKHMPDSELKNT